jgi:hypothetical protein
VNNFFVVDHFVPESLSSHLDNLLHMPVFPWYYYDGTIEGQKQNDSPQFVHSFLDNDHIESNFYHEVSPIIVLAEKYFDFNIHHIVRVKSNFLYKNNLRVHHPLHDDETIGHISLLYYVNDSDGDTVLYSPDNEVYYISPKKGRLLAFPSHWQHASSSPLTHKTRIVVNCVVKPKEMPND